MERVRINREDELFIWMLKADLACVVYYQSQVDTAAEADDLRIISKEALGNSRRHSVISKEALGNSWGILSAILGHKYHQNHLQPKIVFDHVCVFQYAYALLMFDLDLVSEWRLARFRHLGWMECGYVFLSWTTLVIIDFSYFKQYEKIKYKILIHRQWKRFLPLHLFIRVSKLQDLVTHLLLPKMSNWFVLTSSLNGRRGKSKKLDLDLGK